MPSFARLELRNKLLDLGHQYLTTARANEMVDEAAQAVILEELWPLRRMDVALDMTTFGLVGGAVLGPISSVRETSVPGSPRTLDPIRQEDVRERFAYADAGTPRYYYVYNGTDRTPKLGFFPTGAVAVQVTHWSTAAWVTGGESAASDADVTVWPRTHAGLLMARARFLAYEDIDDYDAAAQQEAKYQRRLDEARDQLLVVQWDEPEQIRLTQDMV